MIKHLGEGLVPFEDCGFARYPAMPCVGEEVIVRCRVDRNDSIPMLRLRGGEARPMEPVPGEPRFFRASLGKFETPRQCSYRIEAGEEQTGWHTFEVVRVEIVSKLDSVRSAAPGELCAFLGSDVTLIFRAGERLEITLAQTVCGEGELDARELSLPGGFSIRVMPLGLWTLLKTGNPVLEATEYRFWRDCRGMIRKAELRMRMPARHILGTGERFDAVERKGLDGTGQVVEKFTHQGSQTYLPIPFFLTEQGFGWLRDSDIPAGMSFGADTVISQETEGSAFTRDVLFFGEPDGVLRQYLEFTGENALPPEWSFGVWISSNGWNNDAEVDAQLAMLRRYDYPASVMVLEQWSDERTFYTWHPDHFPKPDDTVRRIRKAGMHLVLWQIPIVKHEWDGVPGAGLENDIRDAIEHGYVIRDGEGKPYRITERWFHNSLMPDFTNPQALRWWFGKREHLLKMGVEGFKTDGGEFLFDRSVRLHDGTSGLRAHNLYPNQYVSAYQAFLRSRGVEGVTFSRAGYTGAHSVPIHWAGDQASEWEELRSQLNAGISAGISGVLFWGFDVGGFAGPLPDAELYLRATAMACFSPVMQWHSEPRQGQFAGGAGEAYNNDRSPWNMAKKLKDERVLDIACRFARLRESLRPYLWEEARHCVSAGRPMMAHLCLDYPSDERAWETRDEYMLGRRYLVAPLTREGEDTRTVYLPEGVWRNFFTGETVPGGGEVRVTCTLDQIPVFERVRQDAGVSA